MKSKNISRADTWCGLTMFRNQTAVKRQRTGSRSVSPLIDKTLPLAQDESDEAAAMRNGSSKKARSSRNPRERSEREEKEKQRQEAANKRKVRADRRRAEGMDTAILVKGSEAHADADSDPSEELPLATARAAVAAKVAEPPQPVEPPAAVLPTPDTPPTSITLVGSSHKRSGRIHPKKLKGRNQYSKDVEGEIDDSPARSMSRDPQKVDDSATSVPAKPPSSDNHNKSGPKGKNNVGNKLSMGDMKRRATAFMDFITRTQVELAGDATAESRSSGQSSPQEGGSSNGGAVPRIRVNGDSNAQNGVPQENGTTSLSSSGGKDFKDLDCIEMMGVLARDLTAWQNKYGS